MRRLPVVIAVIIICLYAWQIPKVISDNPVKHPDCLTGYRVEDC